MLKSKTKETKSLLIFFETKEQFAIKISSKYSSEKLEDQVGKGFMRTVFDHE